MKAQIPKRQMNRRAGVILLVPLLTGLLVAGFWSSMFTKEPMVLRFLYYTNNEVRSRIVVMEISNCTDVPYDWRFHSAAKAADHLVGVCDLLETNGELRGVSPFTGCNLFGHDALHFGTDEFKPNERFWVDVMRYPKSAGEVRRVELSGWLWRHGWRRVSTYMGQGRRINGPVLPPDPHETAPIWPP